MDNVKKPELLAPSGDFEAIRTALKYGADAIYMGGPFMQLRAASAGFSEEELGEAAELIHARGKRLYVTVNCFAKNEEIEKLGPYAKRLRQLGVDAVIVSDIGAVSEIREQEKDLEVHLSTQANCMNYKAARVYHDMGVSRIVLARELSIDQIAELRAKTPKTLELEGFVHGAMCMAYSGRCIISSFLTGRSGNRGECAQSCRWNYYLMEQKRPGEYFPIEEGPQGTAIMSSKELCCIEFLDKLRAAGISSFKVEGRMRTPFYIGTVINAYRMAIDGSAEIPELRKELETVSHRPYCEGFYFSDPESAATGSGGYVRDYLFVATALENSNGGRLRIETRNHFSVGDEIEVLTPGHTGKAYTVEFIENEEGSRIDRANVPMSIVTVNAPDGIEQGDILRRKDD